jgi:hypothetical protein
MTQRREYVVNTLLHDFKKPEIYPIVLAQVANIAAQVVPWKASINPRYSPVYLGIRRVCDFSVPGSHIYIDNMPGVS